jgi:hypothetical protein
MVAPTRFGITLPSSGSVPSAFWEILNWGAVDRILWMGVLCLVTWCPPAHLPNCIICMPVLPAQLYYLHACAAWLTVLFACLCCLPNCIICMSVLPAQLHYLQVCAACPTPRLIPKVSNSVHPRNNIHETFPTVTWPDITPLLRCAVTRAVCIPHYLHGSSFD